jgi:outer membrane biosynthesis protein TonB
MISPNNQPQNTPRPTRNAQQVRSLIQNMGRSIDEARDRRLGTPAAPAVSNAAAALSTPSAPNTTPTSIAPSSNPRATTTPGNTVAPPIRAATEMFVEGGARLKARPKRMD